jgi:hypothetical protein
MHAFLYLVATIPTYRTKLETDPIGTFADLGITLVPSDVPEGGIQLPSNDEILAKLDELSDELSQGGLCYSHIVCFLWLSN